MDINSESELIDEVFFLNNIILTNILIKTSNLVVNNSANILLYNVLFEENCLIKQRHIINQ